MQQLNVCHAVYNRLDARLDAGIHIKIENHVQPTSKHRASTWVARMGAGGLSLSGHPASVMQWHAGVHGGCHMACPPNPVTRLSRRGLATLYSRQSMHVVAVPLDHLGLHRDLHLEVRWRVRHHCYTVAQWCNANEV